jgi:hypothetical protein
MVLCELCKTIPFRDLPQLPDACSPAKYYAWEYQVLLVTESVSFTDGFKYWSNIEALREAATGCELCNLILPSVEKVATAWDKVTKGHYIKVDPFVSRYRPKFEMRLWKRIVPCDGFLVITNCESPSRVQVVAAVDLSVKEGRLTQITSNRMLTN